MNIKENISIIKENALKAELVVVTKHQRINVIKEVYKLGEKNFGENRVQDLVKKHSQLPKDIKWHMIGHLQKNKVKHLAPFIYMIQSVDSIELLEKINQEAQKNKRKIKCLIQYKISEEKNKFGFQKEEIDRLLNSNYCNNYKYVKIEGLMAMASFSKKEIQIEKEFQKINNLFKDIKLTKKTLSIGMSNDYRIACKWGSTMIRIGSFIFN